MVTIWKIHEKESFKIICYCCYHDNYAYSQINVVIIIIIIITLYV